MRLVIKARGLDIKAYNKLLHLRGGQVQWISPRTY